MAGSLSGRREPALARRQALLSRSVGTAIRTLGSAVAFATATALAALPADALPAPPAKCVPRDEDALIILDASFSMLRAAGTMGLSRFAAARQAVNATLQLMPDDAVVGLRVYGSMSQAARMSCTDTLLAVPFAQAGKNRPVIKAALADTHARGLTPIAYTLEVAAGDFAENALARTIILVSDGGETCGGDPCSEAATLAKDGLVINTVGFYADPIGSRQLQCIATATGGGFFNAPTALQLQDQLAKAMGICPIALGPPPRLQRHAVG